VASVSWHRVAAAILMVTISVDSNAARPDAKTQAIFSCIRGRGQEDGSSKRDSRTHRRRIKKIVTGGLNIVALRRWIKLKARRRFRKALGAPQSAKIHRPKIKNSHSGNRENRAERRLHVTHKVKNRTQYLLSYVCLVALVIDFLRCWTVRAPRPTI
jgi:hypothetical protein